MILTMPIFITCMVIAFMSLVAMVAGIVARCWLRALLAYFLTGLWLIAIPFKIGLHATSLLAMAYISAIWPIWLMQPILHINPIPNWLAPYMFNL